MFPPKYLKSKEISPMSALPDTVYYRTVCPLFASYVTRV